MSLCSCACETFFLTHTFTGSLAQSDIIASSGAYTYGFARLYADLAGTLARNPIVSCAIRSPYLLVLTRNVQQRATLLLPYLPFRLPTSVTFHCSCAARAGSKSIRSLKKERGCSPKPYVGNGVSPPPPLPWAAQLIHFTCRTNGGAGALPRYSLHLPTSTDVK